MILNPQKTKRGHQNHIPAFILGDVNLSHFSDMTGLGYVLSAPAYHFIEPSSLFYSSVFVHNFRRIHTIYGFIKGIRVL